MLNLEGETTAIHSTFVSQKRVGEEPWYDLSGRSVNLPHQKGLYLTHGRKLMKQ